MKRIKQTQRLRASGLQNGFSLIEIAMALGVAAFCLLTIFGLLSTGLNTNQNDIEQTAATGFVRAIAADLLASGTSANSPIYRFTIPTSSSATTSQTVYLAESGSATSIGSGPNYDTASPSRFRASLYFTPATSGQRNATMVRILMTWPAFADPSPLASPKNYAGSYEIFTALDRN